MFLARHRRAGLVVWAIVLAIALPVAPRVMGALAPGGFSSPNMESQRVGEIIASRFGHFPSSLVVVFTSTDIPNRDPRFLGAIDAALAEIRALDVVASVTTPRENPAQLSADGTTGYALIGLRPAAEEFRTVLPRIQSALRPSAIEHIVTGAPVFYDDIQAVTERDLRRAEAVSLPLAAVALLLVFGSAVAALLPALVGGVAVLITLATMAVLSGVTFISVFSLNMVTMLGLGLGIDYALFIVSRFREELRFGQDVPEATARALATAGQSVLFSGATVFVGLLALIGFPYLALRSLGIAGALVVAVSVVAALGLLPLLLLFVGRAIDRGRVPRPTAPEAAWSRIAEGVMAHPVRVLIPSLTVLLLLGLPFLSARFGAPDASILPQDVPSRRGADLLRDKFSEGELIPAVVVLTAEGSMLTPERIGTIHDFVQRVARQPGVGRVDSALSLDPRMTREQYQLLYARPDRLSDPFAEAALQQTVRDGVMILRVAGPSGQTAEEARSLVRQLRAVSPPPGMGMLVGGGAAGALDYVDGLYEQFPRAVLFVCLTSFLLLLVLFGSVILPLKAIAMNALSITASFGALVVVFQDGFLSGPLGFQPPGYVEASLPILMFCVLFGLSMDYEVFLLSRVMEAYQKTGDNRLAVAEGLQQSGAVITSAAAIIVLVAGSFVAADVILIKALGFGTAIAVLLDATLVRTLLVPATMCLLGRWNWWAPAPLRRLAPRWGLRA
jgi:putative drug exporter of the RND superfamily